MLKLYVVSLACYKVINLLRGGEGGGGGEGDEEGYKEREE